MKSKELKTYNLPADEPVLGQIDAKPNLLFLCFIFLGLLSFLFKIPALYGLTMIAVAIIAMAYMPRVLLIEFYSAYLVLYNKADRDNCFLIYYDDVTCWYYSWSPAHDYLYIELQDGSIEKIEAFSKPLFEGHMNRFLKEKHKKNVR